MTAVRTAIENPYWDAVTDTVGYESLYHGPVVKWLDPYSGLNRTEYVGRYAWTVSDPDTVAFIAYNAGPDVLDPMAGTGYWAWLLRQSGSDVLAFDANPPGSTENTYHKAGVVYLPVLRGDAVEVTASHGGSRTLLLSWPPYDDDLGDRTLAAYAGSRVVYIGEGPGGCCGDDSLFTRLERDWEQVDEHRPVQWDGLHDYVTVYTRRGEAS